jgi:hypothetical protein
MEERPKQTLRMGMAGQVALTICSISNNTSMVVGVGRDRERDRQRQREQALFPFQKKLKRTAA